MKVRLYILIMILGILGLAGHRPLGAHEAPKASAPTHTEALAYVAMGPSNNVAAIDIATGRVVATLAAGWNPHGLGATPDGRYLVVTSRKLKTAGPEAGLSDPPVPVRVTILDTMTFQTLASLNVGGDSHHAFVSPKGRRAYVTVPARGGIAVIDIPDRRVIGHVKTGSKANSVATSPDGKTIYVTNKGDDTLSVVDDGTLRLVASIRVGIGPDHLTVDKTGRWLYVTNAFSNDVSVVDLEAKKEVVRIPLAQGPHGLGLSPDGGTLYVSSRGEKVVSAVDVASRKVVFTRPVGKGPGHLTVTPDGGAIYVNDEVLGKIWVLEPETLKARQSICLWPEPHETVMVLTPGLGLSTSPAKGQ